MSTKTDASGAGEILGKELVPKEYDFWDHSLGHMVKSHMTVIERWGAI